MLTDRAAPMPSPVPQRPGGSSRSRRISSSPPGGAGIILLDAVPEDESSSAQTLSRRPSPPSSNRSAISNRQRASSSREGNNSTASGSDSQDAYARQRAPWVFDILESQEGSAEWAAKHRVVLVLGDATADTLRPLLHDPCFGDTLVLVGTPEPIAEIESLLSSYHIRDKHDGTHIYPRVQTLSLSTRKGRSPAPVHPLPELLAKATEAAKAFLAKSSRRPLRSWASSDSVSSLVPPGSVPMRTRTSSGNSLGRVSSRLSTASGAGADAFDYPARPGLSSSYSSSSLASSTGRPQSSRVTSFRRDSMMNLRAALDGPSTVVVPGQAACPFDAVVNIIPDPKAFGSQRAMHGMLHQTVVLTTGIMPVLSRKSPKPVLDAGGAIPLLHVLPPRAPPALPTVIENYLLALLPSFQNGDRPVWAGVVSDRAWRATSIGENLLGADHCNDVNGPAAVSGAQAVLFGGLRCPVELTKSPDGASIKPRAFLGSWKECLSLPGLLHDAAGPSAQAQLVRAMEHTAQMADQAARSAAPVPAPTAASPRTSRLASGEQAPNGGRMRSRLSSFVINSDDLPAESPEIESQQQTPFFAPESPMPELMQDSARGSASSASSSSSALNDSSAFSSGPPSARSLRGSESASSDGSHSSARMPAWGKGPTSSTIGADHSVKGRKKGFMGWFQSKKRATVVTA